MQIVFSSVRILVVGVFFAVALYESARAAEMSIQNSTSPVGQTARTLLLEGRIVAGDSAKFAKALVNAARADKRDVQIVMLNSSGGDLVEAIRIGEIIREARLGVGVFRGMRCVSACFIIFLSGNPRLATGAQDSNGYPRPNSYLGVIGLHRPYLLSPNNTPSSVSKQAEIMQRMIRFLDGKLVPRRLTDQMMARPSNDIYWLNDMDLSELGDYPPELEELYVSQCNFDRHDLERAAHAKTAGDTEAERRWDNKVEATRQCELRLNRQAYDHTIGRLEKGWLPAIP